MGELLARGVEVEIVSPDPVAAAHRYLKPAGLPGCLRIARMARRYDAVIVQLEPGLPVRYEAGRIERALSLLALSAALRQAHEVTVRVYSFDDLPGGPGGRAELELWRRSGRIVVASHAVRDELVAAIGSVGEAAVVEPMAELARTTAVDDAEGWGDGAEASAENVVGLVRARAALERRQQLASGGQRVSGWDRLPTPGVGVIGLDAGTRGAPPERGRARALLAAAERRRWLLPAAGAARAAHRSIRSVLSS